MTKSEIRTATIFLFPKGHGGREAAYNTNVSRVGIVLPKVDDAVQFGSELRALNEASIPLGKFVECHIRVMNFEAAREHIRQGDGFCVFEGARLIGIGFWSGSDTTR